MARSFENTADALGNYLNLPTPLTSTVTVQIVDDLSMTKTADPMSWADGVLTFTVEITNDSSDDYTEVIISDILDPNFITLIDNTVTVDGDTVNYTYDPTAGLLTILPGVGFTVPANSTVTVTFQVDKA